MQSEFCLPVNQLLELHRGELIYVLLKFFPIMLVTKENVSVLLDLLRGDASSKEIAPADDNDDSGES